jgi:hypothetical protein
MQCILVIDGEYSCGGGEESMTVGSHSNFPKERRPSDLNEDNEEEDRAQSLDPSARPGHRRIKDNLHTL